MKICKIFEMSCFVVNPEKNDDFEHVLSILMVPMKGFDETTNTYAIHMTYKLMSYIQRECRFRGVTILSKKMNVVNDEEYKAFKAEKRESRVNRYSN